MPSGLSCLFARAFPPPPPPPPPPRPARFSLSPSRLPLLKDKRDDWGQVSFPCAHPMERSFFTQVKSLVFSYKLERSKAYMMAHEAKRMEKEICLNGTTISDGTEKMGDLLRSSVCFGKCTAYPRLPFACRWVEPKLLAAWKAPQA